MLAAAFTEWPDQTVVWAIGITLTLITWAITDSWRKVRRAEIEANLKHEMLQRGMTPGEIERVLRAPRPPLESDSARPAQRQPAEKTEAN